MRILPQASWLGALYAAFACAFAAVRLRGAEIAPRSIHLAGIENAFQVTDRIYSGSQPEGDEAFTALQKLGVKTILSVDGTQPDVQRAAKYGLRYVHIPHGYDGIPTNTAVRLAKAATAVEGPLFVHCHHGKHRGPAAVAVMCEATAGWSTNQAVAWMKLAGTALDYAGLYRSVSAFHPPTAAELAQVPSNFPTRAPVSGLVEAMVAIDRGWDNLKLLQQAGWKAPADQPDLVAARESLLLLESYRELARNAAAREKGGEFLKALQSAEDVATDLHSVLKAASLPLGDGARKHCEQLMKSAAESCTSCHKQFRN